VESVGGVAAYVLPNSFSVLRGHDRHVAGVSRRCCGLTLQRRKSTPNLVLWRWLPEWQQGHHLSWQSPVWGGGFALRLSQEALCMQINS